MLLPPAEFQYIENWSLTYDATCNHQIGVSTKDKTMSISNRQTSSTTKTLNDIIF